MGQGRVYSPLSPSPEKLASLSWGLSSFAQEGSEAQRSLGGCTVGVGEAHVCVSVTHQVQGDRNRGRIVFMLPWLVARCYCPTGPNIGTCKKKK